ncbi:MAG: queuosine precursor transporter [Chitinophagales bacterium]
MSQYRDDLLSPLFVVFTSLFITCLLISNIIACKIILVFGLTVPSSVILFPITYIISDALTEVYGFERARLVVWLGFTANIFMVIIFMTAVYLPYPDFWKGQEAFKAVLGFTPRLVAASLPAYFLGQMSNAVVLSRMKVVFEGSPLWTRTIGSTMVGEGVDTLIFITVAFLGTVPLKVLGIMILGQYIWKVGYEALLTPLTYAVIRRIKKHEGIDTIDRGISYNLLKWGK